MKNIGSIFGVSASEITKEIVSAYTGYSISYSKKKLADCRTGRIPWSELSQKRPANGGVIRDIRITLDGHLYTTRFVMDVTGKSRQTVTEEIALCRENKIGRAELLRKVSEDFIPAMVRYKGTYYNSKNLAKRCNIEEVEAAQRIAEHFGEKISADEMMKIKPTAPEVTKKVDSNLGDIFSTPEITLSKDEIAFEKGSNKYRAKRTKERERNLRNIPGPTEAEKRLYKC